MCRSVRVNAKGPSSEQLLRRMSLTSLGERGALSSRGNTQNDDLVFPILLKPHPKYAQIAANFRCDNGFPATSVVTASVVASKGFCLRRSITALSRRKSFSSV